MRWEAVLLAVLVATAGCLGATGDPSGEAAENGSAPEGTTPQTTTVQRTLLFEADVPGPQVEEGRLDVAWPTELGVGLVGLELQLEWTSETNGFGLETERPDGTVHKIVPPSDPMATSVEGEVTDLVPGEYVFHLTSEGPTVSDHVTLEATATWELADEARPAVEEGTIRGPIRYESTTDGWRASVTYRANGTAAERMQVQVDTTNGYVRHDGSIDRAAGIVTAWARGDSRDQARDRVLSVDVDLQVTDEGIQASATAPDWDQRGADVATGVPATTTASARLDTTNGGIAMRNARVDGVVADTTNGAIEGQLTGQGRLLLDTTNGNVDVSLDPTGSVELDAHTTNGGLTFALAEDDETAYTIDADTTNGRITASMDEARLEGDEDDATLRTEGGDGRPIQVTGTVETTNGNIGFEGR